MAVVRYAETFAANLEAIQEFMLERDLDSAAQRFEGLLGELDRAAKLVARHPGLGRPASFLDDSTPRLRAARSGIEALVKRVGATELREYVLRHYLILYAVGHAEVTFLAIRAGRQSGYNL